MHFKKNSKGYVCGNFNKHGIKACSSHRVREAALSTTVLSTIKEFIIKVKTTDLYNKKKIQIQYETLKYESLLKELNEDLSKLKKIKSKSISMLIDDVITKDDYDLFINDIDEQIKDLEHSIFSTKHALDKLSDTSLLDELNKIRNEEISLDELTPELLHRFIKKIKIEEDGTPQIFLKMHPLHLK